MHWLSCQERAEAWEQKNGLALVEEANLETATCKSLAKGSEVKAGRLHDAMADCNCLENNHKVRSF